MSVTLIIIIMTCIVSFTAFNNQKVMDDLIFYPPAVSIQKQFYRFFTCGFIHANIPHLLFNMYSFWIFGEYVEIRFMTIFGPAGRWLYLLMYLSALLFCLLPTYKKNKENYYYKSLGASGAVSAVIFAFIFLDPLQRMGIVFLPPSLMIPGFIFGAVFLVLSSYLNRRDGGNINHSAHIWGALYGVVFLMIFGFVAKVNLFQNFISQIQAYLTSF